MALQQPAPNAIKTVLHLTSKGVHARRVVMPVGIMSLTPSGTTLVRNAQKVLITKPMHASAVAETPSLITQGTARPVQVHA